MQIFASEMKYLQIAILVSFKLFSKLTDEFQKFWTLIKNENRWTLEIRCIKTEAFHKRLHCNHSLVTVRIFWQFHKFQWDELHLAQNLSKLLGKVFNSKHLLDSTDGLYWYLFSYLNGIELKPGKKSSTISQNVQCNIWNRYGIWIAITKRSIASFIPADCCWSHSTFKKRKSKTDKSPFFCNYSQLLILPESLIINKWFQSANRKTFSKKSTLGCLEFKNYL